MSHDEEVPAIVAALVIFSCKSFIFLRCEIYKKIFFRSSHIGAKLYFCHFAVIRGSLIFEATVF